MSNNDYRYVGSYQLGLKFSRLPYVMAQSYWDKSKFVFRVLVKVFTIQSMEKQTAIEMLGGTPKLAAEAMGYASVHAVYMWPDVLRQSVADQVRGVLARMAEKPKRKPSKAAA